MSERDAAASTSMQKLAPPGHTLHHSHRSTGRPSRAGDSFIYPERRPSSLSSPPLSPRASLNLHEYPPLSPTATVVDSATHKKKKTLAIIPSRSLLSSVAGGVHGLPISENHELSDKDRQRLARFHRFPLPADDESHAGLRVSDLSQAQQRIIQDVLELIAVRPTREILERTFARDCTYTDPNVLCVGWEEVAAQWFFLPKVFPKTRTLAFFLLKPLDHLIRWEMVVEYTWAIGTTRMVHSIVELEINSEGKVAHMVDRWEGKELNHRMAGIKRVHAKLAKALIHVP